MLYTIGYQRLTPAGLLDVVSGLEIGAVLDVRSVPSSRRPGFSSKALQALLGARYQAWGASLGGKGKGPTMAGLRALAETQEEGPDEAPNLLLLCLEEAPGECHRHHRIAVPLARDFGVDVTHVYRDELVIASDLQTSMDAGGAEYECELWR